MTKELDTHIVFNENCEYQSSSTDETIEIESQPIHIGINIINKNGSSCYYYNDKLEIQAEVFQKLPPGDDGKINEKYIKTGRIEFYYQPITSNKQILLNKEQDTCILSKQGNASIYFIPNQSGKIIAKYIDESGWFATTKVAKRIDLDSVPVSVKFLNQSTFSNTLYPMEDGVDIKVTVTPTLSYMTNYKLNYGYVTFFKEIENKKHMIGNPVPVINGEAKIKYIPEQYTDSSNNFVDNKENIYAMYNYVDENHSINNWQYFNQVDSCTIPIYIYKKHSILLKVDNNNNFDGQQYKYEQNDNINLSATLVSQDKNLTINSNDDNEIPPLKFYIEGQYITIDSEYFNNEDKNVENYFIYNEYSEVLEYDSITPYEDDNNLYKCFIKTISDLNPGEYTIHAVTDSDDKSNMIYINVDFKSVSYDTKIIYNEAIAINSNEPINQYINGEVTINYVNPLIDKKCYFFIPEIQKTYTGTLSRDGKNKLKGELDNDLYLPIGDYSIYMYLLDTYYTGEYECIKLNHNNLHTNIIHVRNN